MQKKLLTMRILSFRTTSAQHSAPLKLRPYGAIEIRLLLLLLLLKLLSIVEDVRVGS